VLSTCAHWPGAPPVQAWDTQHVSMFSMCPCTDLYLQQLRAKPWLGRSYAAWKHW